MAGRRIWAVSLPIGAAMIGTLVAVVGIAVFGRSFVSDLLAGAVGVAFSVAIAVTLVERGLEHTRARKWAQVRGQTIEALRGRIWNMTIEYPSLLGQLEKPPADGSGAFRIVEGVDAVQEQARALERALAEGISLAQTAEELHKALIGDFDYIRTTVTPRVVSLSPDPHFVELLINLEHAEEDWRLWLRISGNDRGAWYQASRTLTAAADLFVYLVNERE